MSRVDHMKHTKRGEFHHTCAYCQIDRLDKRRTMGLIKDLRANSELEQNRKERGV